MATKHANLWAALVAAHAQFSPVVKDKTAKAGQYTYNYADLAAVLEAVMPALSEHGIAVYQAPTVLGEGIVLVSKLVHADTGQEAIDMLPLPVTGNMQQLGSAISYARRYLLMAQLGIAGEDDDGEAASNAPAPRKASVPPPAQKTQQRPTVAPTQHPEETFEKATNGNGAPDPHKWLHAEIEKTFAPDDRDDARHWMVEVYTAKNTPDDVRTSSADLSDDECLALVDALKEHRGWFQKEWKART